MTAHPRHLSRRGLIAAGAAATTAVAAGTGTASATGPRTVSPRAHIFYYPWYGSPRCTGSGATGSRAS
ncbi:hypothetical protein [Streptomyces sp. NPDC006012]|uniref:hypothetical protein n=1 Tax=Streptomyces sp. NPDC006012 TaxID=3364739 RepID=UPI0036B1CC8C